MATPEVPQLPNPFTNLAFLPPDLAFQVQIARYFLVGTTAVYIWDLLANSYYDFQLLFKKKFSFPTAVYFLSKLFAFTFCFTSTIFETTAIGHCQAIQEFIDVIYPLAISFTCLLFFLRLRAVYADQKWVVAAFFVLWLGVVGANFPIINSVQSITIGPTQYCLDISIKSYDFVSGVVAGAHDALVFFAISYRVVKNHAGDDNPRTRAKVFLSGKDLPFISKKLLKDGQLYFFVTVISNTLNVIMVYTRSIPITYRAIFIVPNLMLTNSMACRIFRHIKFHLKEDSVVSTTLPTIAFRRPPGTRSDDSSPEATRSITELDVMSKVSGVVKTTSDYQSRPEGEV